MYSFIKSAGAGGTAANSLAHSINSLLPVALSEYFNQKTARAGKGFNEILVKTNKASFIGIGVQSNVNTDMSQGGSAAHSQLFISTLRSVNQPIVQH